MIHQRYRWLAGAAPILLSMLVATPAGAQDMQGSEAQAPEGEGEIIIVTAQKRETDLQETPASVSAMSGDTLRTRQIVDIEGLAQQLPSVNFGQTTGNARIAIRGVGFDNTTIGNEGRVAYHADGVFLSRPAAALTGFFDLERVEVLRGPQGTLYGRNATGGAINVIPRAPGNRLNGYLEASYGNYDAWRLEGAIGGPIAEGVSARVSFQLNERDGFGTNLTNGRDVDDLSTRAVRARVRLAPSPNFEIALGADWFHQDDHAYSFHYLGRGSLPDPNSTPPLPGQELTGIRVGGTVPVNLRDSTSDSGPDNERTFWGLTANARLDLGPVVIHSITGYRDNDFQVTSDLDVTSAPITVYDQFERSHHFSQELRLSGEFDRGDWMIGGYYFTESLFGGTRIALDPVVVVPGPVLPPLSSYRQGYYGVGQLDTDAWALFASLRFKFTDQLALRLGAHYSDEHRRVDEELKLDFATPWPPFVPHFPPTPPGARRQAEDSWSSFTPSATLEYRAHDDLFLYATWSRGFKSGGFNLGVLQPPYAPERLDDYEAGIRAQWLGGRLTTNLSAFYYDYSNLQVTKIVGTAVVIENAASARIMGLEAEIVFRPVRGLQLDAAISLLDTEYEDYVSADPARPALGPIDLSGNALTQSPTYTINLGASYVWQTDIGEIALRAEGRFVDRIWFTQFNLPHTSQPAYALFNAYLTWRSQSDRFSATAFIRNIGNEDIVSAGFIGSSLVGSPLLGSFEPPRTYGVTLGVRF